MFILCFRCCIAFWDTHFVEDSWKNDVFRACFVSKSPNNGGLPSNQNNNDTAKHNVSGCNAQVLLRMYTRVFTNAHFVYPTLEHACLRFTFLRRSSLFYRSNCSCIIVFCKYFIFVPFFIQIFAFYIILYIFSCKYPILREQ